MYKPTWKKFVSKAAEYMNNETTSIFGYYANEDIAGMIVVQKSGELPKVRGIAVDPQYRQQGIGKQFIQYACSSLDITTLMAETDDDAVMFYRNCGFETEEFMIMGDSGEHKRYKCTLHVALVKT
ncbi:MAG: GNAT family N-acetyltransferase [Defluviitaleaceae bacterium]|nr:GNAT family N-acetyltransferase [Defluviitaleaceae bacterium]